MSEDMNMRELQNDELEQVSGGSFAERELKRWIDLWTEIIKAMGNEAGVERFYREVYNCRLPYDFTGWDPEQVASCLVNCYFSRRPPLRGE